MNYRISLNAYDLGTGHPVRVEFDAEPATYQDYMDALLSMVMLSNTPPGEKAAAILEELFEAYNLPVMPVFNDFPVTGYTKHKVKDTPGAFDVALWGDFGDFPQETIWWNSNVPGVKTVPDHGKLFDRGEVLPVKASNRAEFGEYIVKFDAPMDFIKAPKVQFRNGEPVQKLTSRGNPDWRFMQMYPFPYGGTQVAEAPDDEPWRTWTSKEDFFEFALGYNIFRTAAEAKLTEMVKLGHARGDVSASSLAKPFYDWVVDNSKEE